MSESSRLGKPILDPTEPGVSPSSVAVIETRTLRGWERQWDRLVDTSALPTHSLRSWWLHAARQRRPLFVLVVAGQELLGGLALEEEQWRGLNRYRVLGDSMWPLYFDAVSKPQARRQTADALSAWFGRSKPFVLELRGVNADSGLEWLGPGAFEQRSGSPSYYAPLPMDFGEYTKGLSSNLRKEMNRRRRQLAEAGYRLRRVADSQVDRALDDLERLHRMQFGDRSTFLPFFPSFRSASEVASRTGELVFYEAVDATGATLAVDAWFMICTRAVSFIGGRSPEAQPGTGVALLAHAIEEACQAGFTELDLGGGFSDWKRRWAPFSRPQLRISGSVGASAKVLVGLRDIALRLRRGRAGWIQPSST